MFGPDEQDRLLNGDILLNTRNTLDLVGKVAVWRSELPRAYFNSNLMRLEFDPSSVASTFLMNSIMNSRNAILQLREFATGTTSVAAIYTRDLLKVKVSLPKNHDEQVSISAVIEDMSSEITALEQKRDKTKLIKQGMMQETAHWKDEAGCMSELAERYSRRAPELEKEVGDLASKVDAHLAAMGFSCK